MQNKKKLYAKTLSIQKLSVDQIDDMFSVFSKYYSNTNKEIFLKDLSNKDSVFLLLDKASHSIKGFSTIKNIMIDFEGRMVRGVFSGDTIIEKDYWGQGTLGVSFLKYLFWQKIKKPFEPLYWFLISKGYKTYLLMANNFPDHYPRFERITPVKEKHLIDGFSKSLYGDYYCENTGVISFSKVTVSTKDCLKEEVSPISNELMASNKRIEFFAKLNPNWHQGDELSCVAQMTFFMPLFYQLKFMKKSIIRICHSFFSKIKVLMLSLGLGKGSL
ncbi:MAG: hypothetical protein K9K67_11415 [Bacteriovoracaceae bacterium]|nr:hypothetical protein [Bacteriovoracaceae bacterium]